MYQLLVSGAGWAPNRDSLHRARVFEHTAERLVAMFKPEGQLWTEGLLDVPAIFASETQGDGNQIARVGSITRVRLVGTEVEFDYTLNANLVGIPNAKLQELARELDINGWEFSRTHWAVKDVDLFKVLLEHQVAKRPAPKVFRLSDDEVDSELVAVMMPFDAAFRPVYEALRGAITGLRLECRRADDIWEQDVIIQDVVSLICRSAVVICDLSGKNANVFYETGIAHTLGREVILLTQHETDVPFDLRHIRHVRYLNNEEGRAALARSVSDRLLALVR